MPDVPKGDIELDLKPTSLSFTGTSGTLKRKYHVVLDFFAEIDPAESKINHTAKNIEMKLQKKELKEEYWPRLLKDSKRLHFLKTDFDKWVDEDEQNEAPEEDFSQFGGMGGMPGMGGTWAFPDAQGRERCARTHIRRAKCRPLASRQLYRKPHTHMLTFFLVQVTLAALTSPSLLVAVRCPNSARRTTTAAMTRRRLRRSPRPRLKPECINNDCYRPRVGKAHGCISYHKKSRFVSTFGRVDG